MVLRGRNRNGILEQAVEELATVARRASVAAAFKDGSRFSRSLVPTSLALKEPVSPRPRLAMSAPWTPIPRRPSQSKKVFPARLFGRKLILQFHQRFRIICHTRQYYILGVPQSRRYPPFVLFHGLRQSEIICTQTGLRSIIYSDLVKIGL